MPVIRIIIAVFISLTCFITPVASQLSVHNAFKTLNVANGLPQSFISGMVQDSTGFIWIGTRDGLARYDGRKYKIFRHTPGDTTTLSDNIISNLFLDKQERLWIYYEAGDIDVLNTATELILHFTKDPVYKSVFASVRVRGAIAEDSKSNIWLLGSNGGIFICNLIKRSIHFYSALVLGLYNGEIVGIQAEDQNILLITNKALIKIDANLKLVNTAPYTFPNLPDANILNPDRFIPLIKRKNGDIILIYLNRVILYNDSAGLYTAIPLPAMTEIANFCIAQDSKGQVFFEFNYSIYVLSAKNKLDVWRPKEENPAFGFKSMLIDRSGVLWLGGNGSGIQLFDLRLSRLSGRSYEKNYHEDVLQRCLQVPAAEVKKSFLNDMSPYLFRWASGSNGKLWLSKAGDQYNRQPPLCYYKNHNLFLPAWHYTDTSRTANININGIALSASGKLWGIDFYFRPVYFDTLTHAVTVFPSVASVNFSQEFTVSSLLIDGEDVFWISTAHDGLFCHDRRSGKTIHYSYSDIPGSLPVNQLMNMVQDPLYANILWIASMGGGLIKFDKATGKCHAFTTSDGLPNNTVYAAAVDASGILWCSSNKGIFSFNPRTLAIRSFLSKDGLSGDEFNRYHFLQMPDGRIAFGGVEGYTVFDPLSIEDDNFQPGIALTGINLNNIPADFGYPFSPLKRAINSADKIVLPYNQNFISFEFAALQYNITEKLQYRYMLKGYDDNWVNAGNDNVATYTRIEPGHYTLMINATNTAGEWSDHIKTLSVVIEPPFWKTWWFTTLCVLALASIIYLVIISKIKEVRKEEQQKATFEREASELKAQALRAQMNPHFIFNCLNSIKALIQEDNKQQAVIYLTTFSKLIRSQLNNAEREISLHEELETCRMYTQLEALRFGNKIICEFKIEEGIDTYSLHVPPLILQPFIENAIWHGILPKDGGKVNVLVTENNGYIQCAIEDNGIGRETSIHNKSQTSATYQSKGLKLVQGRLNLHNIITNLGGSIELVDKKDQNGIGTGTLVIVKFKKEA